MSVTFWPEGHVADGPDLNVADGNAGIVFAILGVEELDWATPDHVISEKLVRLDLLSEQDLRSLVREDRQFGNLFDCGAPIEQVESYVTRLRPILEYCLDHETGLCWG